MNALVFLYKKVLKVPLNDEINAVRAAKKINMPVVMTREEVHQVCYPSLVKRDGHWAASPLDDL